MANKTVGALIVVIIFLSAVTVSIIAYPKPKIDESSDTTVTTPTPQPTNLQDPNIHWIPCIHQIHNEPDKRF
jgi:hypothetical protein